MWALKMALNAAVAKAASCLLLLLILQEEYDMGAVQASAVRMWRGYSPPSEAGQSLGGGLLGTLALTSTLTCANLPTPTSTSCSLRLPTFTRTPSLSLCTPPTPPAAAAAAVSDMPRATISMQHVVAMHLSCLFLALEVFAAHILAEKLPSDQTR
jgi:hypothetical protein